MLLHTNVYQIYMTGFSKLCRDAHLSVDKVLGKSTNSPAGYIDSDGSRNHFLLLIRLNLQDNV